MKAYDSYPPVMTREEWWTVWHLFDRDMTRAEFEETLDSYHFEQQFRTQLDQLGPEDVIDDEEYEDEPWRDALR